MKQLPAERRGRACQGGTGGELVGGGGACPATTCTQRAMQHPAPQAHEAKGLLLADCTHQRAPTGFGITVHANT